MDLTKREREYIRQLGFPAQNPEFVKEVLRQPNREFIRGSERPKMCPVGYDGLGGFQVLVHLLRKEPIGWPKFV